MIGLIRAKFCTRLSWVKFQSGKSGATLCTGLDRVRFLRSLTRLGRARFFIGLGRDEFLTWLVGPWYLIGLIRARFCTRLGKARFQSGISGATVCSGLGRVRFFIVLGRVEVMSWWGRVGF